MVQVVEILPYERQGPVLYIIKHCGYWFPDDTESQGISSHKVDLDILEYSSFYTRMIWKKPWKTFVFGINVVMLIKIDMFITHSPEHGHRKWLYFLYISKIYIF